MDLKRLIFKDSFIYGSIGYLSMFTSLFLTPIYTRLISKSSFGVMDVFNTWIGFLSILLPLGLTTIIIIEYNDKANDEAARKKRMGAILMMLILVSAIFILISLFFRKPFLEYVLGESNEMTSELYYEFLIIVILSLFRNFSLSILRSQMKKYVFALMSFGDFFILTFLGFILVYFERQDILGYFRASVVAGIYSLLVGLWLVRKEVKPIIHWPTYSYLLTTSIHFLSAGILLAITNIIDRLIVTNYFSLESMGIFSISIRIAGLCQLVISSFALAWYPFAMQKKESKELPYLMDIIQKVYLLLCLLMLGGIIIFRNELIYIFAPGYQASYHLIPLFVILNIVMGGNNIYTLGLHYSKKTKFITYGAFISVSLNIAISIIGALFLGMEGVVIGSIIGGIAWVGYQYAMGQKYFKINISIKYIMYFVIGTILFYITSFVIDNSSKNIINWIYIAIKGALFIGVGLFSYYYLNRWFHHYSQKIKELGT